MVIRTALLTASVILFMGASCNKNKATEEVNTAKIDDTMTEPETPAEDSADTNYEEPAYSNENNEEAAPAEEKYDYQDDSSETTDDSSY